MGHPNVCKREAVDATMRFYVNMNTRDRVKTGQDDLKKRGKEIRYRQYDIYKTFVCCIPS